jgi:hypothetical protein
MKFTTFTYWLRIGICVAVCLAFVACNKRVSPQDAKQILLDWNLKTTVDVYQKEGNSNPKWDELAKRALTEFARAQSQCTESNEAWELIISTNCAAAVDAGCNDPMIAYLYASFTLEKTNSHMVFADAFRKASESMENSSYPEIWKFYVAFQAVNHFSFTYPKQWPPEFHEQTIQMDQNLIAMLGDKTVPPVEACDACGQFLGMWQSDVAEYQKYYHRLEELLFKNWPNQSDVWIFKGANNITMAWQSRGNDYADKVTQEGWKSFAEHLTIAAQAFSNAWKLNPKDTRTPSLMLTVELGQGQGRERMELWFNRAMELDPNNYDACSKKLYYLQPKWYGSPEDMLSFGHECVQNTKWSGQVPLILASARNTIGSDYIDPSEQSNYWKMPEVWADINSSYQRYFELNPDQTNTYFYQKYALYAYRCEQWNTLNELIPKIGSRDHTLFATDDEFDKMLEVAKENNGVTNAILNK